MSDRPFFFFLLFLSLSGLFLSCSSEKGTQPDEYLNHARELIKAEQFQKAKTYVDSVQIRFPKNFAKIREGLGVMREINFAEQKRTLSFCDSMLKVRQKELPEAQKNFVFEKDPEYETVGNYVHRSQAQDHNYGHTFLQTKVDEKGNLILTSYYSGRRPINHNSVRASAKDGSYAECLIVPKDGALNFTFKDNGINYEIVRFNRKAQNGIIDYILMQKGGPVYIELTGGVQKKYKLTPNEREVMKSATNLSVILSDINKLLDEIHLSQAKLDYIYNKQQAQRQGLEANSN